MCRLASPSSLMTLNVFLSIPTWNLFVKFLNIKEVPEVFALRKRAKCIHC